MANRAITVMYEGVPNYPDFGRFWEIVAKHKVNIFYTAPTALRALMKEGDAWPSAHDLSSLRLLGTVGEPIKSPEWTWYHEVVGKGLFETEEGEAEPEATSLSHFLAQSPPSSPAARAFRTFTPSPKDGNAPGGRPVLPLAPSPPPAERVVIRA